MVAYNLLLSIFPLALIALFVAGRVLRSPELAGSVIHDARTIFPTAAESTLVDGVRRLQQTSTTVGIVALVSSLWVGASFWGALDTAFCRIYQLPCRSWVRQKLFGFGMLLVSLLFIAASVAVPTVQSLLASSARRPAVRPRRRHATSSTGSRSSLGLVVLFGALCITYAAVPKGAIPWTLRVAGRARRDARDGHRRLRRSRSISRTSRRCGSAPRAVFVLIALVWFYVLALIVLAGAVVNELRFERVRSAGTRASPEPRVATSRPAAPAPTPAREAARG